MTKEAKHSIYSFTVDPALYPTLVAFLDRSPNRSETIRDILAGHVNGDIVDKRALDIEDKRTRIALNRLKIWTLAQGLGFTQPATEGILNGAISVPVPDVGGGPGTPALGPPAPVKPPVPADFEKRRAGLKEFLDNGGDLLTLGPEYFDFGTRAIPEKFGLADGGAKE